MKGEQTVTFVSDNKRFIQAMLYAARHLNILHGIKTCQFIIRNAFHFIQKMVKLYTMHSGLYGTLKLETWKNDTL